MDTLADDHKDGVNPVPQEVVDPSSADMLLRQLSACGIDYLFANGGTDFPPIVEAYSRAAETGAVVPEPVVVPHENAAVAMAHGYYLHTGRMQAVMVHVNVGTANAVNALLDASRENIPLLLMAGRSPYSEDGHHGTRTRYIHWAQEMFDQGGLVREAVKWDYELHLPDQTGDVVVRAAEIAASSPKGPVYLTLPRDVLGATDERCAEIATPRPAPAPARPDPQDIDTVAEWLAASRRPLIVTANAGRDAEAFRLLATLAERYAIPVASFHQRFVSIASDHPMNAGHDPAPFVKEADLIVVLESDVPWIPTLTSPAEGCRVVHVGEDPLFSRYPVRSFPSDLSVATGAVIFLDALAERLEKNGEALAVAERRWPELAARIATERAAIASRAGPDGERLTPDHISRVIGEVAGDDAIIVNEYPLRVEQCRRTQPGTYFGLSPAGGLGWGLGAALGIKLADRGRTVIATLGDGAYIFANPSACHWVAAAQDLPVLTIVFNNGLYGAVRNSTVAMYPDGASARGDGRMLADLNPRIAFESLAGADGHGERVETVSALRPALERGLAAVRAGRQALINIIVDY